MNWKKFLEHKTKNKIAFIVIVISGIVTLYSSFLCMRVLFWGFPLFILFEIIILLGIFLTLKKPKLGGIILIVGSSLLLLFGIIVYSILGAPPTTFSFSIALTSLLFLAPLLLLLGAILKLTSGIKKILFLEFLILILVSIIFTIPFHSKLNDIYLTFGLKKIKLMSVPPELESMISSKLDPGLEAKILNLKRKIADNVFNPENEVINPEDWRYFPTIYWSPDYKKVAYRAKDRYFKIIDIDGTNQIQLSAEYPPKGLNDKMVAGEVVWSHKGDKVILVEQIKDPFDWVVQMIDLEKNFKRDAQYVHTYSSDYPKIDWSSDDSKIFYFDEKNLWIQNSDEAKITQLPIKEDILSRYGRHPVWSPNGQEIAYFTKDKKLCIIEVITKNQRCLTSTSNDGQSIYWSPNGNKMFYTLYRPDCSDFCSDWNHSSDAYLINKDGTNKKKITNKLSEFVGWTDDNSKIIYRDYDKNLWSIAIK